MQSNKVQMLYNKSGIVDQPILQFTQDVDKPKQILSQIHEC